MTQRDSQGRDGPSKIQRIQQRICALDHVCSGTLHVRTKVCGKPNCHCAGDPRARHGPYYEWSRLQEGRLVHTVLPAHQARLIARAIANHRKIRGLLARWERESLRAIRATSVATRKAPRS